MIKFNRYTLLGKCVLSLFLAGLFMLFPEGIYAQRNFEDSPETYVSYQIGELITVDGKGDEESWKKAAYTNNFIDIEGSETPLYKTRVKMIWDKEYLYFLGEMEEPHVWATLKQRDTIIFYNNDFEIFIDPDGDTHHYFEFEMNALNTIWDLLLVKPYRNGGPVIYNWDINGIKTAVHINGTLNNPADTDKGWSVEIAIPWRVLQEGDKIHKSPVNNFYRINFSRVNWQFELEDGRYTRKKDDKGKFLPEYNWVWSPQGVINMHEPEHWGYVYFSEKLIGDVENFELPADESFKWKMYSLYREQLRMFKKRQLPYAGENKMLPSFEVNGYMLKPILEVHSTGWNIKVASPVSDKFLVIDQDGKFFSY